jgi:general secretion pathway protein F
LDLVLDRLAEYSEAQETLRGRFKAAMVYPIIMTCLGAAILLFLMIKVVPEITKMFSDMEQTLPLVTIILIGISDFLRSFWWLLLAGLAVVIVLVNQFRKTSKGGYILDEIKIRIPVIGGINQKMALARFTRTLGSLLDSGVPLLTALQIVRNIVNNRLISDVIDKAVEEVQAGKNLSVPLSQSVWFPPIALQMISVGEQSGELEKMLHKVADIYERETESRIMAMTSMLQPAMIVAMAAVVLFIALAILLPIFEMNQMVR